MRNVDRKEFIMENNLKILRELTDKLVEPKEILGVLKQVERELNIRKRITQVFLHATDDEMYGEVLQILLEVMESQYGIFGYIDTSDSFICPSITREVWEKCQVPDKTIVYPRENWRGIWGQALISKRSLYKNKGLRVPEGHLPIRNALVVPIIHREELIGLIEIANRKNGYGEIDRELLEGIVNYIAPILSARLQRDGIR